MEREREKKQCKAGPQGLTEMDFLRPKIAIVLVLDLSRGFFSGVVVVCFAAARPWRSFLSPSSAYLGL